MQLTVWMCHCFVALPSRQGRRDSDNIQTTVRACLESPRVEGAALAVLDSRARLHPLPVRTNTVHDLPAAADAASLKPFRYAADVSRRRKRIGKAEGSWSVDH
jgi:hypothetical protein